MPDRIREILSRSNAGRDREAEPPHRARHGARHARAIDPSVGRLASFAPDGDGYPLVTAFEGGAPIRAEPFDAIEIEPPWLTPPAS